VTVSTFAKNRPSLVIYYNIHCNTAATDGNYLLRGFSMELRDEGYCNVQREKNFTEYAELPVPSHIVQNVRLRINTEKDHNAKWSL
jgi:hypothetical protein